MKETAANQSGPLVVQSRLVGVEMGRGGQNSYVCGSAHGLGMSLLETEAKSDSKVIGLSNDGIAMNSHGAECGRRKDQELSAGPRKE